MKRLKIFFPFIFIFFIGGAIIEYIRIDTFDENRVILEFYRQNVKGARMKFDEDGVIHHIGNNNCYYIGIDKNRNLYIRHGDGIAFSEYFTRTKEDNPKEMFYKGYRDLIPQPKEEKLIKLSDEEYTTIISLMEKASLHYRNEPSRNILTSVLDCDMFRFYRYNGNYFNINDDYDIVENDFNPIIYNDLEKIMSKYLDT